MKNSNFQISNPNLESVIFNVNPDFLDHGDGVKIDINANVSIHNIGADSAIVKLKVDIFQDETGINVPFNLSVVYSAEFQWEEVDENLLDSLLNQNAPAILLSYVRPLVANLTMCSKFPPLHIPLMNFTQEELIK